MEQLINDGWKFKKSPVGSTPDTVGDFADWQAVDLPHDWLIWQENDLYESADAWYFRELEAPADRLPVWLMHFDGVYMDCDVWLNGQEICSHAYGYTAFTVDLSAGIRTGKNWVLVHIRHQSPNSRWYSGSGIFRDVTLICLPADYVIPYSFAVAEKKTDGEWHLRITAETKGKDRSLFGFRVFSPSGECLAEGSTESIGNRIDAEMALPGAADWTLQNPRLYSLKYQYGEQTGVLKIGLRETTFDPDHGFFLNGEPVKLHGVCLHHDLGALGAAFHEKAARRQLALMKGMGVNALRTSHNPPAEKLLDLCDEMGILVVDEAFDMWERPKTTYDYARFFPACEEEDVAAWVRRDRCHPSVIMWSIGNEIYDMHADMRGTEITRMLKEQVEKNDPAHHGAVTFGCNYMPWEGGQRCAEIVKVAGYNYGEQLYDAHHRQHPDWVIYGSETASVLSSRGIYHFPIENSIMSEADLQCSALGNSNTSWGALDLRPMIIDDLECSFSMGQFIWSGIDYIGEPTPYHTRSCYFGQADTACFPKDSYYLFRSLWQDDPTLHIGVSWDWNPGQMIDIPVMTNCAEAELFLNGRSLGRKKVTRDSKNCLPVWKIPFEAGKLRAAGYDREGKVILEDERTTPSDTDHLVLTCEDDVLMADGYDLAFVTVSAADKDGNPVDNARDRVRISVSGGGCLMGTDNGDSTDTDGYKTGNRRLFSGKLLAIIGSTGEEKDVTVTAEDAEGRRWELRIPVAPAKRKAGVSRITRIPEQPARRAQAVRKIEIRALDRTDLTRDRAECSFRWKRLPENADSQPVTWQVTNAAGIETPFAQVTADDSMVHVSVSGDGQFYLRAMTGENSAHPDVISQIEFSAEGIGSPALDPYRFVSAGLYDLHAGAIGTGNEKGIAFDREKESMAGFSRVDFGKGGSDTLTLSIFALDGKPYEIDLFDGDPGQGGRKIARLHYEKPSIWNVYQEETYRLPEVLTGIRTLCFRMTQKVHMKGFVFEPRSRAFTAHSAGEADRIYGDSFRKEGGAVKGIGNNVSLYFDEMDFGDQKEAELLISGSTPLNVNTITVRMADENGNTVNEVADFTGNGETTQRFRVRVPGGKCSVSFVFLPGSQFDFEGFEFKKLDNPAKMK